MPSPSSRFNQIKTKKDLPRKFTAGNPLKHPVKLGITVMSKEDKMTPTKRRIGSRSVGRGVQPFDAPSFSRPVSPR